MNARITPAEATPVLVPPARRLSPGVMGSYGFGAAAYGVKDSGFGTFLLLFYNQVVGVPAATVGFVVMIALIVDAFIDPTVGFLSDRTRSRWGRRHPWLYGAALPIMLGWVALWNPPIGQSHMVILVWLFVTAVLVRSAVSAYEVPSQAMAVELSADYDERTRIMSYRYLFGWLGGLLMLVAAYVYFLAPAPGHPNGLLNPAGYRGFAIAGALFMGLAILVSALGTHREIPYLPKPRIEKQSLAQNMRDMVETLKNKAFAVLMLAGLCAYTGQGIIYAISNYVASFVWRFQGMTFLYYSITLFAGVGVAFVVAPAVGRRGSKPKTAAYASTISALLGTAPYWLRLAGWFPAVGDPWLLPLVFAFAGLATAAGVTAYITGASMLADVVEESEVRTGRRSEGLFFAGGFFIQKCTSGVGIFVTGLILAAAGFPAKAVPGQVPVATLDRLTAIFGACYLLFYCLAGVFYARFPFGRGEHEARLAQLAAAGVLESEPRQPGG